MVGKLKILRQLSGWLLTSAGVFIAYISLAEPVAGVRAVHRFADNLALLAPENVLYTQPIPLLALIAGLLLGAGSRLLIGRTHVEAMALMMEANAPDRICDFTPPVRVRLGTALITFFYSLFWALAIYALIYVAFVYGWRELAEQGRLYPAEYPMILCGAWIATWFMVGSTVTGAGLDDFINLVGLGNNKLLLNNTKPLDLTAVHRWKYFGMPGGGEKDHNFFTYRGNSLNLAIGALVTWVYTIFYRLFGKIWVGMRPKGVRMDLCKEKNKYVRIDARFHSREIAARFNEFLMEVLDGKEETI